MERIGRLRQVDRLIRFAVQPVLAHVADDPHDGQPRAGFLLRTPPVFRVQPMDGYVAPGIYGVISCTVGLRTREMGIRMALGAERGAILRMVLKDVLRLLAWGTGCGSGGQRGCPVWLCDLSSRGNRSVRKLTDRQIP